MSLADGQKSFENLEQQDGISFIKNGSAHNNVELQKARPFMKVGSEKSLQSGISGWRILLCLVHCTIQ